MSDQLGKKDSDAASVYFSGEGGANGSGGADKHRAVAALRLVRDVLLMGDWFVERPPLALAFAHPYTRLWCEMWRTEYVGDVYAPVEHKSPVTESPRHARDSGSVGSAGLPASFVRIGLRRLRNPAAVADTASLGSIGVLSRGVSPTLPSLAFSNEPHATAAQRRVRSLVTPVLTYPEPAAATEPAPLDDAAAVRGIPVVDPTASLFTLEAYTEQVFRMSIGMRLGYVRLLTLWLPFDSPSHIAEGGRRVRLVRGLFSHVPTSVTHSAANKAAACIYAAETEKAGRQGPHLMPLPAVSVPHASVDSSGVTAVSTDSDVAAAIDDDSDALAEKGSAHVKETVEDDDWEAIALEEEALLEQKPPSISKVEAVSTAVAAATRTSSCPSLQATPQACIPFSTSAAHHPLLPAAATKSTTTALSDSSAVASGPGQLGDISATIEGVCVALPPPCGWWLRRGVRPSSSLHGTPLPLYAHCIDATRQWLGWLEATARVTSDTPPHKGGDSATQTFLCGVSLSGWSPKYVQPTIVSQVELARRNVAVKLEDAISSTLPLRGLHIESSVDALTRLLGGAAALGSTLIALDAPYLRGTDSGVRAGCDRLPVSGDGDAGCLGSALLRLRRLRFLCINHGRDVLAEMSSPLLAHAKIPNTCIEELLLHGVTGLNARALTSVGRCCVSLRTVDLTSTGVTDDELRALVYGTWETRSKDSGPAAGPARSSPLVCLEEMRLTACHSLTRVDALVALPRLRRLDLHASAVRQVSDLVGCRLLEVVVLTRCEHLTELHPLWRLPRLRCVEADGIRQLQQHRALLPPFESAANANECDAHFSAPLLRLSLSQAATIRGASVGYLARHLCDLSRHATSLVVLLLDHTEVGDDTLRTLAGLPTAEETGGFTGRCLPAASSLRELSLIGCTRVHHLGPLGTLPQLTHLVADHSGVEHVGGLQHSRALDYLSLSHCARLWAISPLAFAPSLRCVDLSGTPLNDSALLRFVYPTVMEEMMAQRHPNLGEIVASLHACTSSPFPLVPSQVEELRICQCISLLHIGCVGHLPRLRRLYVSKTAVFDRGFVGFFGHVEVLLRTQLWLTTHPAGVSVNDDEALRSSPLPDEAALLTAWRRDSETGVAVLRGAPATLGGISAERAAVIAGGPPRHVEFDFSVGAVDTLAHLSLSNCVEVRCIAVFALFHRLSSLDITGTAVDSASLLTFVNALLEGCSSGAADGSRMRLEVEGGGLRPRAIRARSSRTVPAASLSMGGGNADSATAEPPRQCRRPFVLTTLALAWCHYLTDVRCCAAVPSLRHLDLCGAPVDNASIAAFSSCEASALAPVASEEEVQWWWRHRCSLLTLDVSCCRRVTDIAPLFEVPPNAFSGGSNSVRGESSGYYHSLSLTELRLRHSGVASTKEELRALDPYGRCLFVQ